MCDSYIHELSCILALPPDAFAFDVGLVAGRAASKAIKQVLTAELELERHGEAANSIRFAVESRFSPLATCHKSDFVLYKDGQGGLKAGKVQLHCEVLGLPISLVSAFEAYKLEPNFAYSVWKPAQDDQKIFVETCQIVDTMVHGALGQLEPAKCVLGCGRPRHMQRTISQA